ncbi:hypothetical protein MBLNU459_g8308t1 [Dothideomycetes sp. NU459]
MAATNLVFWLVVVSTLLGLCKALYNIFFHPLRKFPGPLLAGATSGWKAYKEVIKQETLAQELFALHEKYGEIVRIGPNEVSQSQPLHFGNPAAFHDIYHGSRRWDKDPGLYRTPGVKTGSFVFLKALSISFGVISVDLLYAFRSFTLDTIMCFTFGNCINALDAPAFADSLILAMDASLRVLPILKNFPLVRNLIFAVPPALVMRVLPNADQLAPRLYQVRDLIQRELHTVLETPSKLQDVPHQTIFHRMLDPQAHRSKTVPDMTALHDEGFTLIFAGANTVADTLLMGHWHTLQNAALLAQLKRELGAVWPRLDTPPGLKDLEALPLLTATIKESLRFIPSGISLTRVVPPGGATVSGQHIPGGAAVGMAILHVHQSVDVWGADALDFRPERWLESEQSSAAAEDGKVDFSGATLRKDLDQWLVPFSRGPRMCFGINLAWAELYIAFATMIRRFDLAIDGTTAEDMEWRECIAAYYPRRHLHAWCRPSKS